MKTIALLMMILFLSACTSITAISSKKRLEKTLKPTLDKHSTMTGAKRSLKFKGFDCTTPPYGKSDLKQVTECARNSKHMYPLLTGCIHKVWLYSSDGQTLEKYEVIKPGCFGF